MKHFGLSILLLLGAIGCKASVNAEAKASADANGANAEGDASFDSSSQSSETSKAESDLDKPVSVSAVPSGSESVDTGEPALLGARRDLTYQGPKDATCSCLAVKLGQPTDSAFAWEKGPPTIDGSRQIVIGMSSEGVACEGERGRGASYKGYVVSQNDVVVMVERAHEGRPVQSGAVIPRPVGDGQIFVVAAEAGSPFGGAPGNPKERCRIENVPAAVPTATLIETVPGAAGGGEPAKPEGEDEEPSEFVDVIDEHGLGEDKPPPAPETRDGFFLGFHPGASYMILKGRDDDAKYTGFGFGLDVLIGGAPSEGFTIGGIIGGATFPSPTYSGPGEDLVAEVDLNLFHVGAFIDYYTDPESGFHLMTELGYVQVDTSGSRTDAATVGGLSLAAGLGYDWWVSDNWSLGLLGRFGFGATEHDQSGNKQWLMLPTLNFTATYH